VVTFFIAILYSWYNGITMEKLLLNRGVLQVDSKHQKHSRTEGRHPFSFCEMLKFNYLPMCMKGNERFDLYEACSEKAEERTDFLQFI